MFKKIKINRNKDIVFQILGFFSSGKTKIAKKLHKRNSNIFATAIVLSDDKMSIIIQYGENSDESALVKQTWQL